MKRLTQRLRTGEVLMASEYEEKYTEQEWITVLQDRIAAYEETGLPPEEVSALVKDWSDLCSIVGECGGISRVRVLAKADRAGRLVVLPAKTVFELTWDAGPDCDLVCPVSIDDQGCCNFCDHGELRIYECKCQQEHIEQIGKTVFLTREEAEAALEAMKDE